MNQEYTMVRFGRVIRIDKFTQSGVILDQAGREFYFHAEECGGELPQRWTTVTFLRDRDYKHTDVACLIKVDRLPSVAS